MGFAKECRQAETARDTQTAHACAAKRAEHTPKKQQIIAMDHSRRRHGSRHHRHQNRNDRFGLAIEVSANFAAFSSSTKQLYKCFLRFQMTALDCGCAGLCLAGQENFVSIARAQNCRPNAMDATRLVGLHIFATMLRFYMPLRNYLASLSFISKQEP